MICIVCGCADLDGSAKIQFFGLPKDPPIREKWLKILKLTCMPEGGAVCSNHFEPQDFIVIDGYVELEETAVPTIKKTINASNSEQKPKSLKRPASTPLERTNMGAVTTLKVRRLECIGKRDGKKNKSNHSMKTDPSTDEKKSTTSVLHQPSPPTQKKPPSPPAPIPFAIHYPKPPPVRPLAIQYPNTPTPVVNATVAVPTIALPQAPKTIPEYTPSDPFVPIQTTNSKSSTIDQPVIDLTLNCESPTDELYQAPMPIPAPSISQPMPQQNLGEKDSQPTLNVPSRIPESAAPKIKLRSIGLQTLPLVSENGKHLETRFFVSPKYVSTSPIWHIQAVKIGEKGVTAMPFTSTICRSSQTSVKDLDLPIPNKLLESLPQEADIGRYIPVTVVVQKGLEDELKADLGKANKKIEKLKGMIDRKNKQIKCITASLQRKMKRIECLKEMILDLKTPLDKPMPNTFYTPSEVEEDLEEDTEFITSLKVLEYAETQYDVEDEDVMQEVNTDQITIIGASQTIEADSSEILTEVESSTSMVQNSIPNLGNTQNCEIIQDPPPTVYSTYMPTENVR